MDLRRIALFGFGEAGQAMAAGIAGEAAGITLAAHDLRAGTAVMQAAATAAGLACDAAPEPALAGADAVLCLVTADQALAAARAAAPFLAPGTLWFDGNSCAPATKRQAAAVITAAGGRYVDWAIMAPVHPRRHRTPGLISGPAAETAAAVAARLGLAVTVAGPEVGDASTIKMLRSVVIKGFEAITAEALLAAEKAGVARQVLASLQASDPGWDWAARGTYNLERMTSHGTRRAAEMVEVAQTLRDLGLPDDMARATVAWQARLGALGLPGGEDDLADRAGRILSALR
jgi:3-hydroxyisobutyrate dehydrogenase-like beta-hydroxyacid dehydrogenase